MGSIFFFYFYKTSAYSPLWALTHQPFGDEASSLTKPEQNEYYMTTNKIGEQ